MNPHRTVDTAVAKGPFEMMKYVHVKVRPPGKDEKQAELAKTARLRALRLIKEAADKEAAAREIVVLPPRSRKRQPDQPILPVS
jgi:hypothetical protein